MTEPTPIALSPKDRFMQIARGEMEKFEESELKLRQNDRLERARQLALPVHLQAINWTPAEPAELLLPFRPATLEAGPVEDLAIIAAKAGSPMRKESLGNMFADARREAGIDKSAHGLRKAAATVAANNDATVARLEAIFGSAGGRMASLYTRSADRQSLAAGAISKLSKTKQWTFYSLTQREVRFSKLKSQW